MNLFKDKTSSSPEKIQHIRRWVRKHLSVEMDVPISISQLQCHEPCCPPIETVISLMKQPVESYKINCAIDDVEESQIRALQASSPTL